MKNLRIIGLTATIILIVVFAFQIFKDGKIDAIGILTLLVLVVDLIYLILGVNKENSTPIQ